METILEHCKHVISYTLETGQRLCGSCGRN